MGFNPAYIACIICIFDKYPNCTKSFLFHNINVGPGKTIQPKYLLLPVIDGVIVIIEGATTITKKKKLFWLVHNAPNTSRYNHSEYDYEIQPSQIRAYIL